LGFGIFSDLFARSETATLSAPWVTLPRVASTRRSLLPPIATILSRPEKRRIAIEGGMAASGVAGLSTPNYYLGEKEKYLEMPFPNSFGISR
jgi:hypothetical protein